MDSGPGPPRGIRASVKRVATHARSLGQLEKELAALEMKQKTGKIGLGAGLGAAAALMALFTIGFLLATIAAALALVVDWWLALLIVFLLLAVTTAILALLARKQMKAGTPLKPVQAIEEAQLTKQAVRGGRAR